MDRQGRKRDIYKLYTPPPKENNASNYRRLIIVIFIALLFVACEIVAGIIAHSISIISDAIHLVCDVIGYFSSFLFLYLSKKPPTTKMTFGFHRMELLGALANIFIVWTLIIFVMYESTHRIVNKEFVEKPLVMLVAAGADLVVNMAIFKVLHEGHNHSHGLLNSCSHSHSHDHHHSHDHYHHHHHGHSSLQDDCLHSDELNLHSSHSLEEKKPQKSFSSFGNKIHSDGERDLVKGGRRDPLDSNRQDSFQESKENIMDHSSEDSSQLEQSLITDVSEQELKEAKGKRSIGMQAAVLHALSDMIMSIGLIISSLVIFFLGNPNAYDQDVTEWNPWHLFDPIATYIFSITALISTLPIISNSYHLVMNSVPDYFDIASFEEQLAEIPGVISVSKVHVWELKPGKVLLTAHAVSEKSQRTAVLIGLSDLAREKKIFHTAFQVVETQEGRGVVQLVTE